MIGAVEIGQAVRALAVETDAAQLCEEDAVRTDLVDMADLAVEVDQRAFECRSAGGERRPGRLLETPVHGDVAVGEQRRHRLLVGGQNIDADGAVLDEEAVCEGAAVHADQQRRWLVGHAADGGGGEAGQARRAVGGDDVDGAGQQGHAIAKVGDGNGGGLVHGVSSSRVSVVMVLALLMLGSLTHENAAVDVPGRAGAGVGVGRGQLNDLLCDEAGLAQLLHRDQGDEFFELLGRHRGTYRGQVEGAGRHGVDRHAPRGEFAREDLGQGQDAGLGGRVVRARRRAAVLPGQRGDVDQPAVARGRHARAEHLAAQEGAAQVDAQHVLEPVVMSVFLGECQR
ncbi:hypothetical protein J518_4114 [Acinetobacter baumannii 1419130]|nr:hypothetical protein J518_4114 [Acinetobacter baumannii 1419130]